MAQILVLTKENTDAGKLYKLEDYLLERIIENAPDFKVVKSDINDSDVQEKILESEIIIDSQTSLLTPENTKNLKWLHLTSAGANSMPKFLFDSDVLVTSSSGVHPTPITEHVLAFMLMFARGINKSFRTQIEKKTWVKKYDLFNVFELSGKKVLIVGLGKIGQNLGKACQALGMEVSGLVRDVSKSRETEIPVFSIDQLKEIVGEFDFVINCLPGTVHTERLFDASVFEKFKEGSYFINIGRGTTVVESDLVDSLGGGKLAGAGLDVFEVEPLPDSSPLWDMESVIITPHYSGWTPKYFERVIDIFIENLKAYLKNEKLPSLVDKKLGY